MTNDDLTKTAASTGSKTAAASSTGSGDLASFGVWRLSRDHEKGRQFPLSFSSYESDLITRAFDFIGLNHYISDYTNNDPNALKGPLHDLTVDMTTLFRATKNDPPIAQILPGQRVDPQGLEYAVEYIREKSENLPIYIQENGNGGADCTLNDVERIDYLAKYMASILKAIRSEANVKGYSVWSFMDLYGILGGYKFRYGLVAVDFDTGERRRQPKHSARWYSDFLKNNAVIKVEDGFVTGCNILLKNKTNK